MTKDTKPIEAEDQPAKPLTLTIDWELYGQYLEDSDMSDAEKREFIEVLWSIVVSFVDLGLGIHPTQLVTGDRCEQDQKNVGLVTHDSRSVVKYLKTTKSEFSASAHHNLDSVQERSTK